MSQSRIVVLVIDRGEWEQRINLEYVEPGQCYLNTQYFPGYMSMDAFQMFVETILKALGMKITERVQYERKEIK